VHGVNKNIPKTVSTKGKRGVDEAIKEDLDRF